MITIVDQCFAFLDEFARFFFPLLPSLVAILISYFEPYVESYLARKTDVALAELPDVQRDEIKAIASSWSFTFELFTAYWLTFVSWWVAVEQYQGLVLLGIVVGIIVFYKIILEVAAEPIQFFSITLMESEGTFLFRFLARINQKRKEKKKQTLTIGDGYRYCICIVNFILLLANLLVNLHTQSQIALRIQTSQSQAKNSSQIQPQQRTLDSIQWQLLESKSLSTFLFPMNLTSQPFSLLPTFQKPCFGSRVKNRGHSPRRTN